MKRIKRIASLLLALALAVSLAVGCFAQDAVITRGEAAKLLLTAADDYCPDLKTEDILKGYPDGTLEEDGYEVRPILRGLGELPGIRQIFMEHLEEAQ